MEPFADWELRPELIERLAAQGITVPTPVQQECWPLVRAGRDLLVQSRTGTGKTLAFGLPLLQRAEPGPGPVEALVVLPTRELAMQVANTLSAMGGRVALLYGGGGYHDQIRALKGGARFVVGTPGRLCDHLERGTLNLESCRTLVLDEADEILDLGFAEELDRLLAALPAERQSLLFSATMAPDMQALAAKTLRDPHVVAVSTGLSVAAEIRHVAYEVYRDLRGDALVNVLHVERPDLAIVFCHTRAETEQLAERLRSDGFASTALHGDMAQAERTRVLNAFRRREIRLLVATDVAARGLDVRGVTHVFNLAVPDSAETYIHRTGRTGRAGAAGTAVTFVPSRDAMRFQRMLHRSKVRLEVRQVPQGEEVRRRLRTSYQETLYARAAEGRHDAFLELAAEMLAGMDPVDAVAAVMSADPAAVAALQAGLEVPVPNKRPEAKAAPPRPRGVRQVQVSAGRRDGLTPASLVKLLRTATGRGKDSFGSAVVNPHSSFVEVREAEAEEIATALEGYAFQGSLLKARAVGPRPHGAKDRPRWPRRSATA